MQFNSDKTILSQSSNTYVSFALSFSVTCSPTPPLWWPAVGWDCLLSQKQTSGSTVCDPARRLNCKPG